MEFSIRAFLIRWPDATLARMQDWVAHDHYHVRRLVSEGTRPRLPWGRAVRLDPAQTLPLLDRLQGDPTRFVTRSVANQLNDMTRKVPDLVIARLQAWQDASTQTADELAWMRKHALRNLVKVGHSGAMQHLGYHPGVAVAVAQFTVTPATIPRGDAADITLSLTVPQDAPLVVDYIIDFVKSGGATAPKVFKLKTLTARAGVPVTLTKRHLFKDAATTFTLYPGLHRLQVQINGQIVGAQNYTLT